MMISNIIDNYITTSDNHEIELLIDDSKLDKTFGVAIITHGIFTDRYEKGRFTRLVERLNKKGIATVRFDFRGHGTSKVYFTELTITGVVIDYISVLRKIKCLVDLPIIAIGSSFGGSIILNNEQVYNSVLADAIVLLNPVTDYKRNFLDSDLEWAQEIFAHNICGEILRKGTGKLGNGFAVSDSFIVELNSYEPFRAIDFIEVPLIVFHGTADDKIAVNISKDYFKDNQLDIVQGAGHAFKSEKHENYVHRRIVSWIIEVIEKI